MASKISKVLQNDDVLLFLTSLFPDIANIKDVGNGSLEIETSDFYTTANVIFIEDKFIIQTNIPENYIFHENSSISNYIDGFSYFYQLFNINPILFKFDKIRKVIYEYHGSMTVVKFMFDTSFGVSAFLSFSNKKSYLSLNGVIINLKKQDQIDVHYNSMFSRFLSEKLVSNLKVAGVEAHRINDFLIDEEINPCDLVDDHIELIKMVDF